MPKILLILAGGFLLVLTSIVTALSWEGYGAVRVRSLDSGGPNVTIPVPMSIAHIALVAAPDEELLLARGEMGEWATGIVAALAQMETIPDGVLISVDSSDESVRIEKRGSRLRIDVRSELEHVEVTLPLRSLTRIARRFEQMPYESHRIRGVAIPQSI